MEIFHFQYCAQMQFFALKTYLTDRHQSMTCWPVSEEFWNLFSIKQKALKIKKFITVIIISRRNKVMTNMSKKMMNLRHEVLI